MAQGLGTPAVNDIVLLILVPSFSLLVYRNVINFHMLILYVVTLPNSLVLGSFFVLFCFCKYLGSFYIDNYVTHINRGSFTSSFLIYMPFISSLCLIAVGRTSITMLSKSGESRYPCLVPDFREEAFSLSQLSMILLNFFFFWIRSLSN